MSKRKSSIQRRVSSAVSASGRPISVIIPTRNEEKLLTRCLDQFPAEMRQRFGLEIIISDAGSTDTTIGIAAAYADKIAEHQDPNHRQTIAEGRNRGAAIADGSIFVFLNADTQLADPIPFFERITIRFTLDPSLAALAVKVEIDPAQRRLSDTLFHFFFNRYVHLLNVLHVGAGRGECQIVRRSAFEAVKGYNIHFPAGEDFDLYHRISHFGKVKYDSKLLVFESPRRFRKFGYFHVYMSWVRNGFATFFSKKAASEVWEEVR
ncbi:MAG TPA: glycosyltransferase [Candidatus Kapabacteria bacterium]|nr:glycosyltransferase [Candidatus Kapabacteria bacterium]